MRGRVLWGIVSLSIATGILVWGIRSRSSPEEEPPLEKRAPVFSETFESQGYPTVDGGSSIPIPNCRFGVAAPYDVEGYDLESLRIGALLDWGFDPPPLPQGVEYIRVLRVRDDLYPKAIEQLPLLVAASPGAYYVVGNEPDTAYEGQDNLEAEVYAERYFALASRIRGLDPSAKIGFGAVVQPTPLRLRYLQRAWEHLAALVGGSGAASALVDFWDVHAFILNEWPGEWGTGVPPGFEEDYADAVRYEEPPYDETHSSALFERRVWDMRAWMAAIGERDKALWITEYGSLFPPLDPPGGRDLINVPDSETARFMLASFDFLLSAADESVGMPSDDHRLVQRWFWYSLNDHRYNFGGSLYDPDDGNSLTLVGQEFVAYVAALSVGPDVYPASVAVERAGGEAGGARLQVQVANTGSVESGDLVLWLYDGEPGKGGALVARPLAGPSVAGCGGSETVSISLEGTAASLDNYYVLVSPSAGRDLNPENDLGEFRLPE